MNLTQINLLWEEYKAKYEIDNDAKITAVKYDTDKYVEGCFNLLELLDGRIHSSPESQRTSVLRKLCEVHFSFMNSHIFTIFIHCPL